MPEPVAYILDEQTFRRLLWKHYGDYPLMRSRWVTGPVGILLGLIGYSGFVADRHFPILGTVLVLTGLHMLASRHLYINKVIKAWKRLPDATMQTRMSIDDHQLCLNTDITSASLSGESIVKVRDFIEGFFVYLTRQHFIAIPRSAFNNDHQYHAWIEAIRSLAGPDSAKEGWK